MSFHFEQLVDSTSDFEARKSMVAPGPVKIRKSIVSRQCAVVPTFATSTPNRLQRRSAVQTPFAEYKSSNEEIGENLDREKKKENNWGGIVSKAFTPNRGHSSKTSRAGSDFFGKKNREDVSDESGSKRRLSCNHKSASDAIAAFTKSFHESRNVSEISGSCSLSSNNTFTNVITPEKGNSEKIDKTNNRILQENKDISKTIKKRLDFETQRDQSKQPDDFDRNKLSNAPIDKQNNSRINRVPFTQINKSNIRTTNKSHVSLSNCVDTEMMICDENVEQPELYKLSLISQQSAQKKNPNLKDDTISPINKSRVRNLNKTHINQETPGKPKSSRVSKCVGTEMMTSDENVDQPELNKLSSISQQSFQKKHSQLKNNTINKSHIGSITKTNIHQQTPEKPKPRRVSKCVGTEMMICDENVDQPELNKVSSISLQSAQKKNPNSKDDTISPINKSPVRNVNKTHINQETPGKPKSSRVSKCVGTEMITSDENIDQAELNKLLSISQQSFQKKHSQLKNNTINKSHIGNVTKTHIHQQTPEKLKSGKASKCIGTEIMTCSQQSAQKENSQLKNNTINKIINIDKNHISEWITQVSPTDNCNTKKRRLPYENRKQPRKPMISSDNTDSDDNSDIEHLASTLHKYERIIENIKWRLRRKRLVNDDLSSTALIPRKRTKRNPEKQRRVIPRKGKRTYVDEDYSEMECRGKLRVPEKPVQFGFEELSEKKVSVATRKPLRFLDVSSSCDELSNMIPGRRTNDIKHFEVQQLINEWSSSISGLQQSSGGKKSEKGHSIRRVSSRRKFNSKGNRTNDIYQNLETGSISVQTNNDVEVNNIDINIQITPNANKSKSNKPESVEEINRQSTNDIAEAETNNTKRTIYSGKTRKKQLLKNTDNNEEIAGTSVISKELKTTKDDNINVETNANKSPVKFSPNVPPSKNTDNKAKKRTSKEKGNIDEEIAVMSVDSNEIETTKNNNINVERNANNSPVKLSPNIPPSKNIDKAKKRTSKKSGNVDEEMAVMNVDSNEIETTKKDNDINVETNVNNISVKLVPNIPPSDNTDNKTKKRTSKKRGSIDEEMAVMNVDSNEIETTKKDNDIDVETNVHNSSVKLASNMPPSKHIDNKAKKRTFNKRGNIDEEIAVMNVDSNEIETAKNDNDIDVETNVNNISVKLVPNMPSSKNTDNKAKKRTSKKRGSIDEEMAVMNVDSNEIETTKKDNDNDIDVETNVHNSSVKLASNMPPSKHIDNKAKKRTSNKRGNIDEEIAVMNVDSNEIETAKNDNDIDVETNVNNISVKLVPNIPSSKNTDNKAKKRTSKKRGNIDEETSVMSVDSNENIKTKRKSRVKNTSEIVVPMTAVEDSLLSEKKNKKAKKPPTKKKLSSTNSIFSLSSTSAVYYLNPHVNITESIVDPSVNNDTLTVRRSCRVRQPRVFKQELITCSETVFKRLTKMPGSLNPRKTTSKRSSKPSMLPICVEEQSLETPKDSVPKNGFKATTSCCVILSDVLVNQSIK